MELDKIKTNAFTLIELLVVIAIIGILSGLIIVGMSSSVNSARIAKAQIFSSSLRDSLLANLVSEWRFDEGTGSQAVDSWSGGYNGTFTDAGGSCSASLCPQWQNSGCVYDKCLSFNGTGAYINLGAGANINTTNSLTIEAWVKSNSWTNGDILSRWTNPFPYLFRVNSSGRLKSCWNGGGGGQCMPDGNTILTTNQWHHVVLTYNGSSGRYFVDGVLDTTYATNFTFNSGGNVWIGGNTYDGNYFRGSIDNVRAYNSGSPISQIKENYYIGMSKLLARFGISSNEYKDKINKI